MTATEVIIVDDDLLTGGLSDEILRNAGFKTEHISDGRLALDAIRLQRPRAVLLDILMPGIDGLSLCRAIKTDPDIKDIKVIIVSGKSFPAEKERAQRFGADLFIEKPYRIDSFATTVMDLVGPPREGPVAGAPAKPKSTFEIKIWGSRSSGSCADPRGRTPCVSLAVPGRLFVFDAGMGIQSLGQDPLATESKETWILLSHLHEAHTEGLGLFAPTRAAGAQINVCGADDPEKTVEDAVRECFEKSFAKDARPVAADIKLYQFQSGDYELLPGVRLRTLFANHPSTTLAFSLEMLGKRIVYCPDSELYGEEATAMQDYDDRIGEFCRGCDVLIHDARFDAAGYAGRKNQGHSSAENAARMAARNDVSRLLLFHADASYAPMDLSRIEEEAREAMKAHGAQSECQLATEGLTLTL
ncbi:MAG: response regulator [Elusimicrobia bacterium]|nr:response regulator [Elusimicrobiota bacterium]